jgi:hypothetical protein
MTAAERQRRRRELLRSQAAVINPVGRPAIHGSAMTAAERQQRSRKERQVCLQKARKYAADVRYNGDSPGGYFRHMAEMYAKAAGAIAHNDPVLLMAGIVSSEAENSDPEECHETLSQNSGADDELPAAEPCHESLSLNAGPTDGYRNIGTYDDEGDLIIERCCESLSPNDVTKVVAQFGDGKWHDLDEITAAIGASREDVEATLNWMRWRGNYKYAETHYAHCEGKKRVGRSFHYRIFSGTAENQISEAEMREFARKIDPIANDLLVAGKKNSTTGRPKNIARLAAQLGQQFNELMVRKGVTE